jgi:hypothetical protein
MNTILSILVLGVAACGTSGVSINDYASKLRDSYCANEVRCNLMPDLGTCAAATRADDNNHIDTVVAAVNAKIIKYDEIAAAGCIDAFNAGCTFVGLHQTSPCDTVFIGTIATAGACFVDEECVGAETGAARCVQTTATCNRNTSCCPGTCIAQPAKGQAGANCSAGPCADGLYCSVVTGTCKPLVTTAGGPCEGFDGCTDPMVCSASLSAGTCVTAAATGASCVATQRPSCADTRDYCDGSTLKCTRRVAVAQPCGGSGNVACVGYASCTSAACVAIPTAGATCTTGSRCLGILQCTAGACTLPAAGMACQ